ncbi:lipocalin-1-like isoform X1 [Oryctolagus cuniculus]|uniref:lipocalin-1-like isoform X1 n=1 Tax=Oryctolagus cuniculus TaxID=9986 RepID=UPI00387A2049
MRLLLLAAGLGLLSALGAQRPPARQEEVVISARSQQLLGRWHIHRWAGTIPFPPEKRSEPLPPFSFVINYNGKLEFRMRILKPSGCQLLKLPFVEYDTGQFSTWWRHPIYIWLVSEGSCGIAYFEDKMNNQDMQMMMLFSRGPAHPLRVRVHACGWCVRVHLPCSALHGHSEPTPHQARSQPDPHPAPPPPSWRALPVSAAQGLGDPADLTLGGPPAPPCPCLHCPR